MTKTVCKSAFNYENIDQIQKDLEINAKRAAVEELFGEFLMGYSALADTVLLEDQIISATTGYVRIAGSPKFKNHDTNLGQVCVAIEAFVTPEDRQNLEPVEIESDEICITENLPSQELKGKSRESGHYSRSSQL